MEKKVKTVFACFKKKQLNFFIFYGFYQLTSNTRVNTQESQFRIFFFTIA